MTPEGPFAEIPVIIKNWSDNNAKPPRITNTTVQTVVIDSAGVAGGVPRNLQIADYEPNRLRLVIQPIDHDIILCKVPPTTSPEVTSATVPPTGRLLPTGAPTLFFEYEFYGPDAWWINTITGGATRVTITKEYA